MHGDAVHSPTKVIIVVDAAHPTGPYRPIWNWVGYDEPNYTYTPNGKKLLGELAALSPEPVRVRTHNLLTSGDGTAALKWGSTNAYTEDAEGNPIYDWTIIDKIFDAYVEAGCIPFVQVGFMPEALSADLGPYRHEWALLSPYNNITTGWAVPPNDLGKWSGLVEAWARHLVERYGREAVETWPWECWNEPDGHYWKGTIPEYCAMYDATVAAVRRVLPNARVGGPHTCGTHGNENATTFFRAFLKHASETGTPLDFIGFHAKGQPVVHEGHVRMGLAKQLLNIDDCLRIISEYPALKGIHAVIGESDPEGCAACSARVHPQNAYRNGPLFGAYLIEHIIRTYELSRRSGIEIDGAVTWAFLFEGQPYFDGFRDLATNGIDKAVLNVFRMLGMLGGEWLPATSSHGLTLEQIMADGVRGSADVNAVATRDNDGVSILVWHYHDDDVPAADAEVTVSIAGWPGPTANLRHFRMDERHSNAFAVWKQMGSPQTIEGEDYERLERAGKLALLEEAAFVDVDGTITITMALPRQGVSLLRFTW
jgi:xylan 1,4-beta-xylosidase